MQKKSIDSRSRKINEIKHFSDLPHIWWGALSEAGQKRYDNRFQILKNLCNPKKGQVIVEIGAGDGEFTKRLAHLPSQTIATDLTPAVVEKGKNSFKKMGVKNVLFQTDDAENQSFKDKTIDIVCGISILHHLNYRKALKESFRILKKGGMIFFSEPNIFNPVIFFGLNVSFLRKRMEFSPDEIALSKYEVREILKETGFSEFKVFNYDFLFPKTSKFLIKAVEKIGSILQLTPLVKEISGSMIIWAKK